MLAKAISLDIYGLKPELFFNKHRTHKSFTGLMATVLTVLMSAVFGFMFGADFFFRANPIVLSQEQIADKSPVIYPTSSSFPVFFSVLTRDKPVTALDESKIDFYFSYSHYKRDSEGKLAPLHFRMVTPKKCSLTRANENPMMSGFNLDEMFCLDWDELSAQIGEPARLGGTNEEDEYSLFRMGAHNCKFDPSLGRCSSLTAYSEVKEYLEAKGSTVFTYYPSFYLDVDSIEKPVITSFEAKPYNLNVSIYRVERRTFEMTSFEDDTGWMFKDTKTYEIIRENRLETEVSVNFQSDTPSYIGLYELLGYIGKRTTVIRRRFMKLQELLAIVGGFIKVVHLTFSTAVSLVVRFQMNLIYLRSLEKKKNPLENSYVDSSKSAIKTVSSRTQLSFFEYVVSSFRCKTYSARQNYDKGMLALNSKLDILNLIQMQAKIEELSKENQPNTILSKQT